MSDLHQMPLRGHDLPSRPAVRAGVFKSGYVSWWWAYLPASRPDLSAELSLRHGPFASWREAYDSARRMVGLL